MYSAELLEEARRMMFHMLSKVVEYGGSDLFISADFPPSIKHQGLMKPLGQQNLPSDQSSKLSWSVILQLAFPMFRVFVSMFFSSNYM